MTLRDDIAAAVAAANSATDTANAATAEATQVRTEAANDRAAAAAALATATTNMAIATTERTDMEERLSTATTLINTLQVQLAARSQAGVLGATRLPPIPGPPGAFALTPGQISPDDVIDYSTKEGKAMYHKAILPFSIIFDGTIKQVRIFQDNLNQRAKEFGWDTGAGDIINMKDSKNETRNVFTQYGCLNTEDIKKHANTWTAIDGRKAQNNLLLYRAIIESISARLRQKLTSEDVAFTINGIVIATLFFKLIMNKTIIDTRATSAAFRRDLANLDVYMATCNSNIEAFNEHVNTAVEGLNTRAERVDDLMTHLFQGYKIAGDIKFVAYIELQETQYMQGSSLSTELLMTQALNDYNTKILNNTWGAPSDEQRKIVALSAELKSIKDNNIELSKTVLDKIKKPPRDARKTKEQDTWKSERGTGPPTMVKDGKTWHWCMYHKMWNFHTTSECKARIKAEGNNTPPATGAEAPVSYAATFAATMAAINEETDSSEPVE